MKPLLNISQQLLELGLKGMSRVYEHQLNQPNLQKQTFDLRLGLMMDVRNQRA